MSAAAAGPHIRVLVADDQALVRAGFRMVVDAREDLTVVGEAADGAEAVAMAGELHPDVVLMDVRMPVMDGIEAARRVTALGDHAPRVLMLTTFDADEYVYEALRAGASGFLLKDAPPQELAAAIRTVARGEALLAPTVTRRLIERFVGMPAPAPQPPPAAMNDLSAREQEVLRLVARGMSNQEIADHLVVSTTTVKTHVARILMKLGLHDRTQAVVLAYETGFVTPGG